MGFTYSDFGGSGVIYNIRIKNPLFLHIRVKKRGFLFCPREESNFDLLLRRESFCPLNYGDIGQKNISRFY